MALDFVVDSECEIKRHFGDADALAGTERILALLKARNRVAAVEAAARRRSGNSRESGTRLHRAISGSWSAAASDRAATATSRIGQ